MAQCEFEAYNYGASYELILQAEKVLIENYEYDCLYEVLELKEIICARLGIAKKTNENLQLALKLMAMGGIRELHTDIISSKALDLLRSSDIKVHFVQEVPFIWNRDHTGWCPVETMCSEEESAEAVLPLIRDFLEKIRSGKKLQEK